ncbi:S1 RNA-binding domain-containing protein [Streptomyces sp. NPDC056632]|uniref:S1 RNA-binding domain-containing protein n=1 Tax=Streptomyces sp. NPDC056632 TaxID=3345884 RepID=UPI00368B4872
MTDAAPSVIGHDTQAGDDAVIAGRLILEAIVLRQGDNGVITSTVWRGGAGPRPVKCLLSIGAWLTHDAGANAAGMDWQSESQNSWAFLAPLHRGENLFCTVAAIERFGVFVALDDGTGHPTLPGVGFIVIPELSWRHIDAPTDVVEMGQRVSSSEFLQFDTFNAETTVVEGATARPTPGFRRPHHGGPRVARNCRQGASRRRRRRPCR